jgi:hypothetical protein
MDCRNFRKNLEDYLQGDLDFPGRFGMERHAQQCFACGKEVSDAQKLGQMAREFRKVAAPPDFEASVLARIHADKRRHSWWLRDFWIYGFNWPSRRMLVVWSSALTLLVAGVLFSFRSLSDEQTELSASAVLPTPAMVAEPAGGPRIQSPVVEQIHQPPQQVMRSSQTRASSPAYLAEEQELSTDADDFIEYRLPGQGDGQLILLPKTIRMRYPPPSEDYFIRNVSH